MKDFEKVKSLLPPVVLQLSELIGFPATEKLIKALGGVQLLMAKDLNKIDDVRRKILIDAVGLEKATTIAETFGGEMIYIPRCDKALRELRNQSLLKDIDNLVMCDYSIIKAITILCPQYGISSRHAWDIIKKRENSTQLAIF